MLGQKGCSQYYQWYTQVTGALLAFSKDRKCTFAKTQLSPFFFYLNFLCQSSSNCCASVHLVVFSCFVSLRSPCMLLHFCFSVHLFLSLILTSSLVSELVAVTWSPVLKIHSPGTGRMCGVYKSFFLQLLTSTAFLWRINECFLL